MAWQAQSKSGLSEHEIRLALKYGIRWRYLVHRRKEGDLHNEQQVSSIPCQTMSFEYDVDGRLLFKPKVRALPRFPDFMSDFVTQQPPALPAVNHEQAVNTTVKVAEIENEDGNDDAPLEIQQHDCDLYSKTQESLLKIDEQLRSYANSMLSHTLQLDFGKLLEQRTEILTTINQNVPVHCKSCTEKKSSTNT